MDVNEPQQPYYIEYPLHERYPTEAETYEVRTQFNALIRAEYDISSHAWPIEAFGIAASYILQRGTTEDRDYLTTTLAERGE